MNKLILADSQAIFRAGTAKVLAMDEGLRIIAQCTDLDRMYHAITTFPGSIVLFAASLNPDLTRMRMLLETTGSRGIVIAESLRTVLAPTYSLAPGATLGGWTQTKRLAHDFLVGQYGVTGKAVLR